MYNLRDKELLALKNRHALTGNVLKGRNAAMKQKVMQKIMNIHWLIISICRLGTKGGIPDRPQGRQMSIILMKEQERHLSRAGSKSVTKNEQKSNIWVKWLCIHTGCGIIPRNIDMKGRLEWQIFFCWGW